MIFHGTLSFAQKVSHAASRSNRRLLVRTHELELFIPHGNDTVHFVSKFSPTKVIDLRES
jgi:hypothetical protein